MFKPVMLPLLERGTGLSILLLETVKLELLAVGASGRTTMLALAVFELPPAPTSINVKLSLPE